MLRVQDLGLRVLGFRVVLIFPKWRRSGKCA